MTSQYIASAVYALEDKATHFGIPSISQNLEEAQIFLDALGFEVTMNLIADAKEKGFIELCDEILLEELTLKLTIENNIGVFSKTPNYHFYMEFLSRILFVKYYYNKYQNDIKTQKTL
jgi:hypothetical protein